MPEQILQAAGKAQPLRRNRDFMILWSGQVVSTLGMRVTTLAYPLLALTLTGSPLIAGLTGFAQALPFLLLYLPAGALIDRLDRKRTMLFADGIRAVILGAIALALALDSLPAAWIPPAVFLDRACFVFFQVAESAALPHIVTRRQLPTALAQNQARELGAGLAGQPLGGILFAVSHLLPFAADALSYAVSFASLLFVRPDFQEHSERSKTRLVHDIAEGLAWLWHQRFLRVALALTGATNLALNALPLVLIVRARDMGAGPALIGVMLAFPGAAAIAGAIAAPWLQRHIPGPVLVIGSLWLWGLGTSVLIWMPTPVAIGAAAGAYSVAGPVFNVVLQSYRYALAPDRLLARSVSAARLITWGTIPFASLVAGSLLQATGSTTSLVVIAAIMLAIAITGTALPQIRQAPRLQELHPTR
jgi:Transmembrane secretion effector